MKEYFIGFAIGFVICIIMVNSWHKRVAKRGYLSIDDKVYEVKVKEQE